MLIGTVLLQAKSNGAVEVTNGISVTAGGMTVTTSGLTVTTGGVGGLFETDSLTVTAGAISISSTSTSAATVDVFDSSGSFSGNLLYGSVVSGGANPNALLLAVGGTPLLQVIQRIVVPVVC